MMLIRALTIILVLLAAGLARAEEEILSFDVVVEVDFDGTMLVTETIALRVEGKEIRRGIIRDIPIRYREADGGVSVAPLRVVQVTRNGRIERFESTEVGADVQIRIGRADVLLPAPSGQEYEIQYHTQGHLRSRGEVDELYWNVTGDRWAFPIRAASVEIRLPPGTPILQHAAYTGPRGAAGRAFEILQAHDGTFRARTTRRLAPGEGFTVAVGWEPGAAMSVSFAMA